MSSRQVINNQKPFEKKERNSRQYVINTGEEKAQGNTTKNSTIETQLSRFDHVNNPEFSNAVPTLYLSKIENLDNVSSIYHSRNRAKKEVEFWVIIETEDFDTREAVFAEEADMRKLFEDYKFTSHVIASELSNHLSVIPDEANKIYGKDENMTLTHAGTH